MHTQTFKIWFSFLVLFLGCTFVGASVTINLGSGVLRNESGIVMPDNGLLQLIASTSDTTFTAPTADFFTGGDDILVASWGLDGSTFNGAGTGTDLSAVTFSYSGNFGSGDLLQLRWFPTLTPASIAPGVNTHYGIFRSDTIGLDGSDIAWVAPGDGSTNALNFLTISAGGSFQDAFGEASFVTAAVPEASTGSTVILILSVYFLIHFLSKKNVFNANHLK